MRDPSVPGWVLDIHERLEAYAVAGGSVPAMAAVSFATARAGGGAGRLTQPARRCDRGNPELVPESRA